MCHGFLSTGEVLWLRRLFSAHQGWAMYNWGSVGKNGGVGKNGALASMLERIDFGPAEMQARCSERCTGALQPHPTGGCNPTPPEQLLHYMTHPVRRRGWPRPSRSSSPWASCARHAP